MIVIIIIIVIKRQKLLHAVGLVCVSLAVFVCLSVVVNIVSFFILPFFKDEEIKILFNFIQNNQ